MDVVALTEKLTSIPSTREGEAEVPVARWLTEYLREQLPWLQIHHDAFRDGRFNVFVSDGAPCRLLLTGHMDTLPVGGGWSRAPTGERVGERFYGRGALDMKGGIATMVAALEQVGVRATRGISLLLYCDEEYEFEGMRHFLTSYGHRPPPAFVVCPEPTQLLIRNGCRGVAELHVTVEGRSGHAARPESGRSAFDAVVRGVTELDALLADRAHDDLGAPTRNVASIRCGRRMGTAPDGSPILGAQANIIPDHADAVVEVRTVPGIDAADCLTAFSRGVHASGATVTSAVTTFDLRPFFIHRESLAPLARAQAAVLGAPAYADLGTTGYSDIQLLASQWEVPCAMLGPSGANAHAADEYVEVESLRALQAMFEHLIRVSAG